MALVFLSGLPLLRLVVFLLVGLSIAVYLVLLSLIIRHRGPAAAGQATRAGAGADHRQPSAEASSEAQQQQQQRHFHRDRPRPRPHRAVSDWMLVLYWPMHAALRVLLWCFGFWYIREMYPPGEPARKRYRTLACCGRGYLARPGAARVIVSTHHNYMDAFYYGSRLVPTGVGKASLATVPLIGHAFNSLNPILVPRSAAEKARLPPVLEQLVHKATSTNPIYQPIVIFPEGTTSSCDTMLTFQRGGFVPGVPVQPVVIDYPHSHLDVAMTPDLPGWLVVLRMLCQWSNTMRVTYLPVYKPSKEERENPLLYASNVRAEMMRASGRAVCDVSDRDGLFYIKTLKIGPEFADWSYEHMLKNIGIKELERLLDLSLNFKPIVEMGRRFWECDWDADGSMNETEFDRFLHLHLAPLISTDRADSSGTAAPQGAAIAADAAGNAESASASPSASDGVVTDGAKSRKDGHGDGNRRFDGDELASRHDFSLQRQDTLTVSSPSSSVVHTHVDVAIPCAGGIPRQRHSRSPSYLSRACTTTGFSSSSGSNAVLPPVPREIEGALLPWCIPRNLDPCAAAAASVAMTPSLAMQLPRHCARGILEAMASVCACGAGATDAATNAQECGAECAATEGRLSFKTAAIAVAVLKGTQDGSSGNGIRTMDISRACGCASAAVERQEEKALSKGSYSGAGSAVGDAVNRPANDSSNSRLLSSAAFISSTTAGPETGISRSTSQAFAFPQAQIGEGPGQGALGGGDAGSVDGVARPVLLAPPVATGEASGVARRESPTAAPIAVSLISSPAPSSGDDVQVASCQSTDIDIDADVAMADAGAGAGTPLPPSVVIQRCLAHHRYRSGTGAAADLNSAGAGGGAARSLESAGRITSIPEAFLPDIDINAYVTPAVAHADRLDEHAGSATDITSAQLSVVPLSAPATSNDDARPESSASQAAVLTNTGGIGACLGEDKQSIEQTSVEVVEYAHSQSKSLLQTPTAPPIVERVGLGYMTAAQQAVEAGADADRALQSSVQARYRLAAAVFCLSSPSHIFRSDVIRIVASAQALHVHQQRLLQDVGRKRNRRSRRNSPHGISTRSGGTDGPTDAAAPHFDVDSLASLLPADAITVADFQTQILPRKPAGEALVAAASTLLWTAMGLQGVAT